MKKNNEYINCHKYTSHYIAEFAVGGPLKVAAEEYQKNPNGFTRYWEELYNMPGLQQFNQVGCAALPVPSLVLFCEGKDYLQHSMIVYDTDAWVGANNGYSLGAPDDYVNKYVNISARAYSHGVQGGWDNGEFHGLYEENYKMYYIPFDINDAGYRYNSNMISGDGDTGCGCIVC